MVLVDTSVWVSYLRYGDAHLGELLRDELVACHPFVIGELACGTLRRRQELLTLLQALPRAQVADDEEMLEFIEQRRLMGRGIGFVDVHLLASVIITGLSLWSTDKRLRGVAIELGIAYG